MRNVKISCMVMLILMVLIGISYGKYSPSPSPSPRPSYTPAPSSSVKASYSTPTQSKVIAQQPKSNNALINSYKSEIPKAPPKVEAKPNYYPPKTRNTYVPPAPPIQPNARTNTNTRVVIKETKIIERAPQYHGTSPMETLLIMSAAQSMADRNHYYENRNSDDYREWRMRAEREAATNAELRNELAKFDAGAREYDNQMPVKSVAEAPKKEEGSSLLVWTLGILGIGCMVIGYHYKFGGRS